MAGMSMSSGSSPWKNRQTQNEVGLKSARNHCRTPPRGPQWLDLCGLGGPVRPAREGLSLVKLEVIWNWNKPILVRVKMKQLSSLSCAPISPKKWEQFTDLTGISVLSPMVEVLRIISPLKALEMTWFNNCFLKWIMKEWVESKLLHHVGLSSGMAWLGQVRESKTFKEEIINPKENVQSMKSIVYPEKYALSGILCVDLKRRQVMKLVIGQGKISDNSHILLQLDPEGQGSHWRHWSTGGKGSCLYFRNISLWGEGYGEKVRIKSEVCEKGIAIHKRNYEKNQSHRVAPCEDGTLTHLLDFIIT